MGGIAGLLLLILLCLIILALLLFRMAKRRKEEQRLLLAEQWSEDELDTEMSTISSSSSSTDLYVNSCSTNVSTVCSHHADCTEAVSRGRSPCRTWKPHTSCSSPRC